MILACPRQTRRLLCLVVALPLAVGTVGLADDDPVSVQRANQYLFRKAAETIATCVVRVETVGGVAGAGLGGSTAAGTESTPGQGPGESPFRDTPGSRFRLADGPTTGLVWSADGYILTSS
ncbi:MAG: hypothetical protein ACYSUI_11485, partial [Planctomycetota bacterium]